MLRVREKCRWTTEQRCNLLRGLLSVQRVGHLDTRIVLSHRIIHISTAQLIVYKLVNHAILRGFVELPR